MALYSLEQEPQNHVTFVFDESYSMYPHSVALVKLFDNEVRYLAKRSLEMNQETRVSVYLFSNPGTARCVLYDSDVLRAQESFTLKGKYSPEGNTALCDAAVLAVEDLKMVPTKYGQHSHWLMIFTDGIENSSSFNNRRKIKTLIPSLTDEWTVSIFVPDQIAKKQVTDWGFPKDNVAIWDTTSERGMDEVVNTVRKASESYFTLRSTGAKGSKSLFSLNSLTRAQIRSELKPLPYGYYQILQHPKDVKTTIWIRDLVNNKLPLTYKRGYGYYELVKNEHIKGHKGVIIEQGGQFYAGNARDLLGLPDDEVKVGPDHSTEYKIFVQSDSHNRNIIPGQRVLYLTGNGLTHWPQFPLKISE